MYFLIVGEKDFKKLFNSQFKVFFIILANSTSRISGFEIKKIMNCESFGWQSEP